MYVCRSQEMLDQLSEVAGLLADLSVHCQRAAPGTAPHARGALERQLRELNERRDALETRAVAARAGQQVALQRWAEFEALRDALGEWTTLREDELKQTTLKATLEEKVEQLALVKVSDDGERLRDGAGGAPSQGGRHQGSSTVLFTVAVAQL